MKFCYQGAVFSVQRSVQYAEYTYDGIVQYVKMLAKEIDTNVSNPTVRVSSDLLLEQKSIIPDNEAVEHVLQDYIDLLSWTVTSYKIGV